MDISLEENTMEKIEPLLYKIIEKIQSEKKPSDTYQKDILFILLIVLMLENGFSIINTELEIVDPLLYLDNQQLLKWKSNTGAYEAPLVISGFNNFIVKLLMNPLGATALVNVVITELGNENYSVCIPIDRYVPSPQDTSTPMIFRELKSFTTLMKNNIVTPVKSRILTCHGYPSASLIGIPEEVLFKIMMYLPVKQVLNISQTCHRLKIILQSECLWYTLCKRDFNGILPIDIQSWKAYYMHLYKLEVQKKLRTSYLVAGTMHDFMDYSDLISYIDNPMWNML